MRRTGRAAFKLFAPRVDVMTGTASDLGFVVVIGNRCSNGALPVATLRQKGRALVYPYSILRRRRHAILRRR